MLFSTTYSRTGSHYLVIGDRHQENCTTSSKRKLYTTSGKINLHFVRVSTLEYGSTPPGGRVKAELTEVFMAVWKTNTNVSGQRATEKKKTKYMVSQLDLLHI